ncbi:hypothetical protein FRC18_003897 [Serendipita sp. 400]|nr:hypothetical protein FRC18_003897 [Serendipita sp. 400]
MGTNRAVRAFFAPLIFRNIHIFPLLYVNKRLRTYKKHQEFIVPTIAGAIQSVRLTRNAQSLEPDAVASLTIALPSLLCLKILTIGPNAPFKEELYMEIRHHPSLRELKISDKVNGPIWKPYSYYKDHPTCRLEYLEVPKTILEDLLREGSPSVETIQVIAVANQPMLRSLHQLGPFPSLHRLILVERSTGTFHQTFWKFLHVHPDLKALIVTYTGDITEFKGKTDPRNTADFRNNLRSIAGPYFLIESLIMASRETLESVTISDTSYRGKPRGVNIRVPIEPGLRRTFRMSFQLKNLQHLSIILHTMRYDLIFSEFKSLSKNQVLQSLRSFGLTIRTESGNEEFRPIMEKIASSLIGNLLPECDIKLAITCLLPYKITRNLWFEHKESGRILYADTGPAQSFDEICPIVMKWAAIPSAFGLDQVEIWSDSERWFTFKRKVPGVQWSVILTPNGGKILPEYYPERMINSSRLFKNVVTVWVSQENRFRAEDFYPVPTHTDHHLAYLNTDDSSDDFSDDLPHGVCCDFSE